MAIAPHSQTLSFVADIGGTNTRVALATPTGPIESSVHRYKNADHATFQSIIADYLAQMQPHALQGACIALAGPVQAGVGRMTNLDWAISEPELAQATGTPHVAILNDLQAQGFALGHLPDENIQTILPGAPKDGSKLVIGLGTGFNIAVVHEGPAGRLVTPSEAGHTSLPMRTETDTALGQQIARDSGAPCVEDALSGPGLENLYAWCAQQNGSPPQASAAQIMQAAAEDAPLARAALALFIRLLGIQTSDLALITLPIGGIFMVGGVARAIAPYLNDLGFAEAFYDKGRFSKFLKDFPVAVISDDYAALAGCSAHIAAHI